MVVGSGRHRLSWKNCEFSHDSRSSSIERQFAFISGLLVKWQGNKRRGRAASQSLRDFSMAHRCDTLALDSPIALDVGYPYPAVNESCSPRLPVQSALCSSSSRDSKQQTVLLPASLTPCSPSRASLTTATFAAIIATATVMDPTTLLLLCCE